MARVDFTGVPQETPRAEVGDDYQHLSVNPAQFGGQVAQGGEALGHGVQQLGDFWGQVQTDSMVNNTNGAATALVEKFKSLRGADALGAQEEYETNLKDMYSDARGKLSSAKQQLAFDNSTRSFYQRFLQPQVYTHANQQALETATNVNNDGIKSHYDALASLNPDDPDYGAKADDAIMGAVSYAEKNAHLRLGTSASQEDIASAVRPVIQNALKTQAQAMAVTHPAKAVEFLDNHREQIGVDYPMLSSQFRTRANEQNALGIVNDAFSSTAQQIQGAPPTQNSTMAVREAILQQESGNSSAAPKSANGAVGPGQIMPATFAQYAKPGEDIANPADNRIVSARVVDDLAKKFDNDPQRIAVGYFSGPGNVAPAGSPTPWVNDTRDATGKSVSSYVQDITHRLGAQGPALAARAGVYDDVLAKTDGHPELRQAALKEVSQRYNASEIADLQDQKARKAASDASLRKYGDSIRAGTPDLSYRKDPTLNEEQVEHLEKLNKETLNDDINGGKGDFGTGYGSIQDRILNPNSDQRITSRAQLLSEYGKGNGNLTPRGLAEAGKWLDWSAKPENAGDRVLAENFYKSAQKSVTLAVEGSKIQLPGAQAKWDQALPVLNKALEAGRAKGLSDTQMMDPKSKDSIWPLLSPFLPSKAEALAFNLNNDVAVEGKAADLTTADGIREAVRSGQIKRDEGVRLATERGFIRGQDTAPQVPTGDAGTAAAAPNVSDLVAPSGSANTDASQWDKRADGSQKGSGFLGLLRRPDGGVSSEISVGVDMGGKEMEIPLMVPTLTRPEVETLLKADPKSADFWQSVPQSIKDKAIAFAKQRVAAGKSPFAGPDESPKAGH